MRTKRGILAILLAALSLSTMAWAVDCPLPDTGQTKCYGCDASYFPLYDCYEISPCPQPGEDLYGQDAQYPCNPHSYTKLDASGNPLPESASSWTMVRDNVTGLIWEVKTVDGSIHAKNNEYTWYNAQDIFIAALNNDNFGGYSDWRLPNIKELSTIVDSSKPYLTGPPINTDYFPNTIRDIYWSSTSDVSFPNLVLAWYVNFIYVRMLSNFKSDIYHVRAVRGGQCGSFDNYIDNGDGTVTSTDTGLMWQQDLAPEYLWQEALSYCENLSLAGYDDWRLPNIIELQSLVDYTRDYPAINTDYFPNTGSYDYWSSTSDVSNALQLSYAWCVNFDIGSINSIFKFYPSDYVLIRAVRGGQCGDTSTTTTVDSTTTTIPITTSTIASSTTTTSSESTTTTTISGICSSELIYGEQSEEVELLRYFRDNVLNSSPEGQEIIRLYYQWSPAIVKAMEQDDEFKEEVKDMIDGVLELTEREME